MTASFKRTCLLTVLTLFAAASAVAETTTRERKGKAFDRLSGELRYIEHHIETVVNGEVVRDRVQYLDANGHVFATKTVDFTQSSLKPFFHFENVRTGHLESYQPMGSDVVVSFQRDADEDVRRAEADALDDAIVDAGFDRLIETEWERLFNGDVIRKDFLVPSRLDVIAFRIRRDDSPSAGPGDVVLEIDNPFLRLIVPEITVSYDTITRRLLRYEGTSNVRDERGENLDVRIEFGNTRVVLR